MTEDTKQERKKATIPVTGITCATCAITIEKGWAVTPGVEQASANFASEKPSMRTRRNTRPSKKTGPCQNHTGLF